MLKMTAVLAGDKTLKQVAGVRKAWKEALKAEGAAIKTEYEKTTTTWKHDVTFLVSTKLGADEMYAQVSTSSRIYWFVHESISVMRGVLSQDWSPKTQPRVLGSGAGSGRLLYASKKISKPPYPAREFTEKIIEVRQPEFQKRMERATQDGLKSP
jgi:hypothetical protein